MKNFIEMTQYAFTMVGGTLEDLLGGFDGFLYALAVFAVIDYVTGLIAAIWEKKSFRKLEFKEIFKKAIIFCLVAVGHIADAYIIRGGSVLRTVVIFFYFSNEGISILENAVRMELPIPERLKAVLKQLREDGEK